MSYLERMKMSTQREYSDAAIELMSNMHNNTYGDYARVHCGSYAITSDSLHRMLRVMEHDRKAQEVDCIDYRETRYAALNRDGSYVGFSFHDDGSDSRFDVYYIERGDSTVLILPPLVFDQIFVDIIRKDKSVSIKEVQVFGEWHLIINDRSEMTYHYAYANALMPFNQSFPCLVQADSRGEDLECVPTYTINSLETALDALRNQL